MELPKNLKHGDFAHINIELISPNNYNPNMMDQADFDMLEDNIKNDYRQHGRCYIFEEERDAILFSLRWL